MPLVAVGGVLGPGEVLSVLETAGRVASIATAVDNASRARVVIVEASAHECFIRRNGNRLTEPIILAVIVREKFFAVPSTLYRHSRKCMLDHSRHSLTGHREQVRL